MDYFNDLNIYIQKNKELFLSNDPALFMIVGKMTDYINLLLKNAKDIATKLDELNDNVNNNYNEINKVLSEFKQEELNKYNDFR